MLPSNTPAKNFAPSLIPRTERQGTVQNLLKMPNRFTPKRPPAYEPTNTPSGSPLTPGMPTSSIPKHTATPRTPDITSKGGTEQENEAIPNWYHCQTKFWVALL